MKTFPLFVLLVSGVPVFSQESSNVFEKAPPGIDEALRGRVDKFYQAHVEKKYREAFALVADDSQDAFLGAAKGDLKGCEIVRINYSENFTKATVVESCQTELGFQGHVFQTKMPFTSNWKVMDGQWWWYYLKPTSVPNPFSPTGFIPYTESDPKGATATKSMLPADPKTLAQGILGKLKLDKTTIELHPGEKPRDELHVRNEMPGAVTLRIDPVTQTGLKITVSKSELQANEEATIVFEYHVDESASLCAACANHVRATVVAQLHVDPTGQVFPIPVMISPVEKEEAPNSKQ